LRAPFASMSPATEDRRRRDGRADRRQTQVLVLTAHASGAVGELRRRCLVNAPRIRPPSLARLLHTTQLGRKEYRSVLVGTQICDGGNFEKCCEFRKNW